MFFRKEGMQEILYLPVWFDIDDKTNIKIYE